MALHRALRRTAGLVFLLVFWVLAGVRLRHGVGGRVLIARYYYYYYGRAGRWASLFGIEHTARGSGALFGFGINNKTRPCKAAAPNGLNFCFLNSKSPLSQRSAAAALICDGSLFKTAFAD